MDISNYIESATMVLLAFIPSIGYLIKLSNRVNLLEAQNRNYDETVKGLALRQAQSETSIRNIEILFARVDTKLDNLIESLKNR